MQQYYTPYWWKEYWQKKRRKEKIKMLISRLAVRQKPNHTSFE
jgi:hypothetical protein